MQGMARAGDRAGLATRARASARRASSPTRCGSTRTATSLARSCLTSGTAGRSQSGLAQASSLSCRMDARPAASRCSSASACVRPPFSFRARAVRWTAARAGVLTAAHRARGIAAVFAVDSSGQLIIAEELGHLALGLISAQISVDPTPGADGSFGFQAVIPVGLPAGSPFGKHLLYFFPGATTARERDAGRDRRAPSRLCQRSPYSTPSSRIEVLQLPPLLLRVASVVDRSAAPADQQRPRRSCRSPDARAAALRRLRAAAGRRQRSRWRAAVDHTRFGRR